MSEKVFIVEPTVEGVTAEYNRIRSIATNQARTGIVPQAASKEQINQLHQQADQSGQKYQEQPAKLQPFYDFILNRAGGRDLNYSLMGRKYMCVLGLTKKSNSAVNRQEGFGYLNKMDEKK